MTRTRKTILAAMVVVAAVGIDIWRVSRTDHADDVEVSEYSQPPDQTELEVTDDNTDAKKPAFDPNLVDSRPVDGWQVNQSAAVIGLDCLAVLPDIQAELLVLRPSYRDAMQVAKKQNETFLPSANFLDGTAKQFDDGMYAALELAFFRGETGVVPATPEVIAAIFAKLPLGSPARPFLGAALELAGMKIALTPTEDVAKNQWLAKFQQDPARGKPIAFYNWTTELQRVWRFYRFLQSEFDTQSGLGVPLAIAGVLQGDPELLQEYRRVNAFFGRLTNPLICLPVDALIGGNNDLEGLAKKLGARHPTVAILPPSTSRETELFEEILVPGVAPPSNLMVELIRGVRSGKVQLAPTDHDGWYQYQVFALETLLLPEKAQEQQKLVLKAAYKKRLIEAFRALVTKRRDTHAREIPVAKAAPVGPEPKPKVEPRLRLEPCATFYLRTARAYAFVQNLLLASLGQERLARLHELRQDGPRSLDLAAEVEMMKQRFYGFYLVACEDIGMAPNFADDEAVDQAAAKQVALDWLKDCATDPDLAVDTRVAVPISTDPVRQVTRFWATIGVRLAPLAAWYEKPPHLRPLTGGAWEEATLSTFERTYYVIAVDEFAEFEMPGSRALTREEFRALCDKNPTKDALLKAVTKPE